MAVSRLSIHHVRNLQHVNLNDIAATNIIFGRNGSGKTSLLEGLNILAMARSFRSNKTAKVVTHGEPRYTVYGELADGVSLGIEKSTKGDTRIQVNGDRLQSVAELVPYLPLQVINNASFGLLTGAPAQRRQYLDWGVFHVEHQFLTHWRRFQRAIKQRNVLLRRGRIRDQEMVVWERELSVSGDLLHQSRTDYFEQLTPVFTAMCQRLMPELAGITLRLKAGWDTDTELSAVLEASRGSDGERGFTQYGPHRDDIRVMIDGYVAADVLSRGQTKLVVCALKLAQGAVLSQYQTRPSAFLVDDLPAELDEVYAGRVCQELMQLKTQLWMTCIDPDSLSKHVAHDCEDIAMFHVEHGHVAREL